MLGCHRLPDPTDSVAALVEKIMMQRTGDGQSVQCIVTAKCAVLWLISTVTVVALLWLAVAFQQPMRRGQRCLGACDAL